MSDELTARQSEEDSHWWFASRTRALLGLLDRELAENNLRVLDVGCGAGNMILHLSRYGSVVGIDNNPAPLEIAHQRGYDARLSQAEDMPFEDESFDLVTTLDVLEHTEDDLRILRECHRVCADGGLVAITVPAFQWLWSHNDVINDHKRRYSRSDLRAKLAQAGFSVTRMTYNNCFIFPVAAPLILARRRAQREPELASPSSDQAAYQVEMEPASPPVNAILTAVGRLEAAALRVADLPFGTSIICLASKETRVTDSEGRPSQRTSSAAE
jgi:SAM-dependent methyltransferase